MTPPSTQAIAASVQKPLSEGRSIRWLEVAFKASLILCVLAAFAVLAALIADVLADGLGSVSMNFITETPSRIDPASSGIGPALVGTLMLMAVCAAFIIPVGVATAVYLEEYANRESRVARLIEINIQNLAAVPSIVYGILGLAFLVRGPLSLENTMIAGGLTLGLLVLPVLIVAGREAIRAVPPSIREGSMALGATKWQTIWKQVLPAAIPGIATGSTAYKTIFAVGTTLFVITLLMNLVSIRFVRKYRQVYE
ncbi:MAG TPA: phosphate ABC transporter permease PstA [Solirubrobacterales bacterium]|nr:phosphate ABC transporter permease PstA [Solirubrobacterales bacterium]